MSAPAPPLAGIDEVASATCDQDLATLLRTGTSLGDSPVRCPVTDPDAAVRHRLDLALRTLHAQPRTHWCRSVDGGAAVVLRWPLPARGIALYPPDCAIPTVLVLAVGRTGGTPDVWRFRWDQGSVSAVGARALALLDGLG